jgi:outer membrane protein assembly factor BamB
MRFLLLSLALCLPATAMAEIQIYSMDHENGRLIKIKEDGTLVWDCPNRNGHDVQLLPNGNVLIVTGKVQEISPDKKVVWELGSPTIKFAESAQRLPNGNTVIGDERQMAVIESDKEGKVVWRYDVANTNKRPRPTMRQMRRLENGNTLICTSTEDEVIEVNQAKEIVWRYKLPFPYLATRLENGNTLISSGTGYGSPVGYFLVEVNPKGEVVWKYGGADAPPDQQLKWPSGFVRHKGLNYISEAQGQAIRVVDMDKKTVRVIKSKDLKHPCTLVVIEN